MQIRPAACAAPAAIDAIDARKMTSERALRIDWADASTDASSARDARSIRRGKRATRLHGCRNCPDQRPGFSRDEPLSLLRRSSRGPLQVSLEITKDRAYFSDRPL